MMEFFKSLDLNQTLTGIVAVISIITAVYKIAKWYHDKTMSEIILNRRENEVLTKDIKNELLSHTKEDNIRFGSIEDKFGKLMDLSARTDEKVTLLINNKIK